MPILSSSGLFTSIERQCTGWNPAPELRLFDGPSEVGIPIDLEKARQVLYDRSVDPVVRAVLWHQIAERGECDAKRSDWPSAVVWLGLPGLRRTAFKIVRYFCAEQEDVEAELVTCYLEALAEVGADTPDPGGWVLRSACSRAWTVWRKARLEVAMDEVEGTGGRPVATDMNGPWQVDYDPPGRPSELSATRRITVPAHRVEGVRIGALAQAWGLTDTATGTRYSGRGRQVAALSLRRVGRNG
ncbi:hypothetical protein [Streptomyces noursei]|uniref:hypothetical protein n=1 Tax=Streptomyces noursei TaxID=1971 RepID=UPI00167AF81A|nr:hypothetical protein [Streptomyces noursei]MCZ1019597.1 hypothetical protein [Streptomyces noursei]GGX09817.1 hypothetical protein GCM10010341_34400 [Streptomyces noursei]